MNDTDTTFNLMIDNNWCNIDNHFTVIFTNTHIDTANRFSCFKHFHMNTFAFINICSSRLPNHFIFCQTRNPCIRWIDKNSIAFFINNRNRIIT